MMEKNGMNSGFIVSTVGQSAEVYLNNSFLTFKKFIFDIYP